MKALSVTEYGEPSPTTASPALTATSPHQGDSSCLWMYQEELVNLYWARDLPLREVREIMKHEHGLDVSAKVYKSQFRRWGIRKNLKRQEALELATGQKSSSVFWPGVKDDEYAIRIARHLRKINRHSESASPHAQSHMAIGTRTPPRRIRAPDSLEETEAAIYYLRIYVTGSGNDKTEKCFKVRYFFEEQEAFSNLFTKGIERLLRNDRPRQAFQDINRAFDQLKQMVKRDLPLVSIKLMVAVATFAQYPDSEICLQICRLLVDHIRNLTLIIHGPQHPLMHIWKEPLRISSGADPWPLVVGVALTGVQRYTASRPSHASGVVDIEDCVRSPARDLDEATLRENLKILAASPDLIPQAHETSLALAEVTLRKGRVLEAAHFYYKAIAFVENDPLYHADTIRSQEGLEFQVSLFGKSLSEYFVEFPSLNK